MIVGMAKDELKSLRVLVSLSIDGYADLRYAGCNPSFFDQLMECLSQCPDGSAYFRAIYNGSVLYYEKTSEVMGLLFDKVELQRWKIGGLSIQGDCTWNGKKTNKPYVTFWLDRRFD